MSRDGGESERKFNRIFACPEKILSQKDIAPKSVWLNFYIVIKNKKAGKFAGFFSLSFKAINNMLPDKHFLRLLEWRPQKNKL